MEPQPIHLHRPAARSATGAWSVADVLALFELPFHELLFRAQSVHREHFDPGRVQLSSLLCAIDRMFPNEGRRKRRHSRGPRRLRKP